MLALIDDYGNPSPLGNGSEWFGFASLLILDNQIDEIRQLFSEVCRCLNRRDDLPIHNCKLSLDNKYHIIKKLAEKDIYICIVAVHIHSVTSPNLKQRGWAYRYYAKEIIRSATHFAELYDEQANIVFHRHEYLNELDNYIRVRLCSNSYYSEKNYFCKIIFDRLSTLEISDDEDEVLLSFADSVAHSCNLSLNSDNRWNAVNPSLLDLLSNRIWKGPVDNENPRLFGAQLEPGNSIPTRLIPTLPLAIRQFWE